ncbi:hypothetical protein NDI76_07955 [Halogeometricum sp. S1BR25-6]|uniref:Uncharacterized protein n=1 Tax=Halogeometricum salsisoli TaxID=2950536 RepID=A0ABU2GEZ4_9EURY|nr:hypothetical protein [Halogeometricum sp. S1BR25-6]MDS0298673.1 hypothetical protein [Halogeometricum sp. S1BR25-6]
MSKTESDRSNASARYHVVCRDCPTESVERTGVAAAQVRSEHVAETGHRVVVGALSGR